jgi:hypothetical protein
MLQINRRPDRAVITATSSTALRAPQMSLKASMPDRKAKRDCSEYQTNGSYENQTPVGA